MKFVKGKKVSIMLRFRNSRYKGIFLGILFLLLSLPFAMFGIVQILGGTIYVTELIIEFSITLICMVLGLTSMFQVGAKQLRDAKVDTKYNYTVSYKA